MEHAEVILGSLAAVDADVAAAWRSGHTGTVTMAVFPSAGRVLLPRLWARLQADPDFPQQLRIVEGEPEAALEVLRSGQADVVVVYSYTLAPPNVPDGCTITRLADDPVVLALHLDEAARRGLAQDRPVDLRDLHDAQWLLPSPPATCHELIRQACGAAGLVPEPLAVATDFTVLTALAAAGAGIAAVPRMALPDSTAGLSLHPLASPIIRTVSAVARIGEARQARISKIVSGLRAVAMEHALTSPAAMGDRRVGLD
ncbi:LysR substrate-binding domain-containing protein [Nonomuraea sp. NPDC000554]|uniref:LysR substrate-binding domain-containing protein n=1 Tax=Nonomuraea sp. NPDC000554 TaxID=3154259 RepID=UPI0033248876